MNLMYLLLFILCFKGSNSDIETYGKSRLYFLCGCEEDDKNMQIKCRDGDVIQMEPFGYIMRDSTRKDINYSSLSYEKCKKKFRPEILNLETRLEIYKKCTLRNSCYTKIAGVEEGQQRIVNHPFYCHSESSIKDISQETVENLKNPIFYFTGEKFRGQKIDCDCSITSLGSLQLELFFIHLKPSTSSKVKFLTQNFLLFESSVNGITVLYTYYSYIVPEFQLKIRGMKPDAEDVIFFRLRGSDLSVNCGGCTNSTDDGSSTSSMNTTTSILTTNPLDDLAPAANTDLANPDTITSLGGILTAVIILNIVGIALYCLIRRRRKKPDTGVNASVNGEQSQYNYIDIAQDNPGFSYTNGAQNGDRNTNDSKDGPNNQYHILEVNAYSVPGGSNAGVEHKAEREMVKQDSYDHINVGGTKFRVSTTTNCDTYNHIYMVVPRDTTLNNTPSDDYSHIENKNGVSKGNLKLPGGDKMKQERKQKNRDRVLSGHEDISYHNVNLKPGEVSLNTEDFDTYNHLQN